MIAPGKGEAIFGGAFTRVKRYEFAARKPARVVTGAVRESSQEELEGIPPG